MPNPHRLLTASLLLATMLLGACSGGDETTATPTAATSSASPTSEASPTPEATSTATATPAPTTTTTPSGPLDAPGYVQAVCEQAATASSRSLEAFVASANAYDAAAEDPAAQAVALAEWAVESGNAWVDAVAWAADAEPPVTLQAYHEAVATLFARMAEERSTLADDVAAEADPSGIWILAQRAWAMTLLEPLPFIPASELVPSALGIAFADADCGPLVTSAGSLATAGQLTAPPPPSPELTYAAQVCWLHELAWEQQQLNLQQLAIAFDPVLDVDELRLTASTYARQEQRTQLLIGLGMQQIVPPADLQSFHDAVFENSATRLVVVFNAEVAIEEAATADDVAAAANDLLSRFFALADALVTIRDEAPEALQEALAGSPPCGALEGSELAFYEALTE